MADNDKAARKARSQMAARYRRAFRQEVDAEDPDGIPFHYLTDHDPNEDSDDYDAPVDEQPGPRVTLRFGSQVPGGKKHKRSGR